MNSKRMWIQIFLGVISLAAIGFFGSILAFRQVDLPLRLESRKLPYRPRLSAAPVPISAQTPLVVAAQGYEIRLEEGPDESLHVWALSMDDLTPRVTAEGSEIHIQMPTDPSQDLAFCTLERLDERPESLTLRCHRGSLWVQVPRGWTGSVAQSAKDESHGHLQVGKLWHVYLEGEFNALVDVRGGGRHFGWFPHGFVWKNAKDTPLPRKELSGHIKTMGVSITEEGETEDKDPEDDPRDGDGEGELEAENGTPNPSPSPAPTAQ